MLNQAKGIKSIWDIYIYIWYNIYKSNSVCVCVWERERERERETKPGWVEWGVAFWGIDLTLFVLGSDFILSLPSSFQPAWTMF